MSLALLRRLAYLVLTTAIALGPTDARAGETQAVATEQPADASTLYERGAAAYRDGRFREAIRFFLAADEIAPRPALSFNVARAYEKLEEPARALEYFRDYLRRDPKTPEWSMVRARIAELEAKLVEAGLQQVTILSSPPRALLSIDGGRYETTPWTGELALGGHRLVLTLAGYRTHTAEIQLSEAGAASLTYVLAEAPAPTTEPSRAVEAPSDERDTGSAMAQPWPWVTLGAGALTLVSAGVVEIMRRDAEDAARREEVQLDYERAYARHATLQSSARILAVVGGGLSLAGGIWVWVASTDDQEDGPSAGLTCNASGCLGKWRGSF